MELTERPSVIFHGQKDEKFSSTVAAHAEAQLIGQA